MRKNDSAGLTIHHFERTFVQLIMSPRQYRMDRRAQTAEHTRRCIVEATFALHAEKGIAATTFRDISARADVGIGTVYHHFPTYDDAIIACGNYTMMLARPPRSDLFQGMTGVLKRIPVLVRELFAFYSRVPAFGRVRSERHQFEAAEIGLRQQRFLGERAARLWFGGVEQQVGHRLVGVGARLDRRGVVGQ